MQYFFNSIVVSKKKLPAESSEKISHPSAQTETSNFFPLALSGKALAETVLGGLINIGLYIRNWYR